MNSGASSDPFILRENERPDGWNNGKGYSDVNNRTMRSNSVDTAKKNLILITAGDSNMTSVAPSAYTATNATVIDNLNMYDGAIYAASEPLLSACYYTAFGPGGLTLRIADTFVPVFDRVICCPCAVGGSTSTMWAAGGILYSRIGVVVKRLAARGITTQTLNCTFVLIYQIGANDHGITQAQFIANVRQTVAKAKDDGFSGKIFIPQYSRLNNATDATIRAAQTTLIDSVTYFDGGDIDAITATASNLQADNTHLSSAGQAAVAAQYKTKMSATGAPF